MIFKNPLHQYIFLYLKKRKGILLLSLLLVVLAKLSTLAAPFALKYIVDETSLKDHQTQSLVVVVSLIFAYVLALFVTQLFDVLKSFVAEITAQPLIASIGRNVFLQLISQSHDSVIKRSSGEIIKEIDRGLKSLQSFVALSIHTMIPLIFELSFLIVFAIVYYDISYGALLILGICLHLYFTMTVTTDITESREILNASENKLTGKLSESLNNFETIKIFESEKFETLKFTKQLHAFAKEAINYQRSYSKIRIFQQMIVSCVLLMMMLRAAWSLLDGEITSGDFVLINAIAMQVLMPITFAGAVWKDYLQFAVDVKGLSKLLFDLKLPNRTKEQLVPLNKVTLKLTNVAFSYSASEQLLKDISLEIPNGSFVAIVGSSGSGKSTLLKLLGGLIHPQGGHIFLNDKKLEFNRIEFSSALAMVPQNVVLFHGSIAENIRYSNRQATDHELIAAATVAQLHERVLAFPSGYETQVGERGLRLSGGERQMLGMARALLKKPLLLLLDEPSSALDAETERKWIDDSLLQLNNMTRVVVSHRLNSVKHADKIFVLESGRLIEQGSHEQLINLGGAYFRLWESQTLSLVQNKT